jgi:hypothetical protein
MRNQLVDRSSRGVLRSKCCIFLIDAFNGQIASTLQAPLLYERLHPLIIPVMLSDRGSPPLSFSSTRGHPTPRSSTRTFPHVVTHFACSPFCHPLVRVIARSWHTKLSRCFTFVEVEENRSFNRLRACHVRKDGKDATNQPTNQRHMCGWLLSAVS